MNNLPPVSSLQPPAPSLFDGVVKALAAELGRPLIYGPNGHPAVPVMSASYRKLSRESARREGSIKTWIPRRLYGVTAEALEREQISDRASDLAANDGYAAGAVETVATTVVGSGLTPHPTFEAEALGWDKIQARAVQAQMRAAYQVWAPTADAAGRLHFGFIQYLAQRSLMQFGEYLALLPMIPDPSRPFSLAVQLLHPSRLATPGDKLSTNIIDGVEIGTYGRPVAYWIKKVDPFNREDLTANVSANYVRIPAADGWRVRVLHGFLPTEPEQVRGISPFAPIMKPFKDLSDFVNAELVSNIVTAAFSLFIETGAGQDPLGMARGLANYSESGTTLDGESETRRYQEMEPGLIMYGASGEKPHPIAANRPGSTFDPFVQRILKKVAAGLGVPYAILFKDMDYMSFAGYRGAMLEAWRRFTMNRVFLGQHFCSPIYAMLMEEAWLRDQLDVPDFYAVQNQLCQATWTGYPKGDIEPLKAIQVDKQGIEANLKTMAEAIAERGGDLYSTLEQRQNEQELLREKGLAPPAGNAPIGAGAAAPDDDQAEAEAFMERMAK